MLQRFSEKTIIFLIVITIPLGPLATDSYLPSLPAMVLGLHTSKTLIQLTLSIYILGLGISQLFYGPLADRFGRRHIILIGTTIFFASSVGCIISPDIFSLMFFRFLQGLGFGCGFVVATAIMGDVFTGKTLAKVSSYSAMAYSITPIIAPVIGGYIQEYIGWRANFGFMSLYALFLLLCLWFLLPETIKQYNLSATQPKTFVSTYATMSADKYYISNVVLMTLSYGIMIAFSVIGPFLLQNVLNFTAVEYGKLALLIGLSYFLGTSINSRLLKWFSVSALMASGVLLMLISSIALIIWIHYQLTATSLLAPTCVAIFGMGLIFPNGMANAMAKFFQKAGRASALMGSYILIGCTIISAIAAHTHTLTAIPLAYIYLILSGLSAFALYFVFSEAKN